MTRDKHVVLITGGATGIGFALAKKFLDAGNRVVIVGRTEQKLAAAAAVLPGVSTSVADISKASDRDRLVADHPDVSILVNNAGIQDITTVLESTAADIEHEFNVNLLAPVLLCRGFLPALLQRESAAIVNVSSGLALVPKQTASVYCASKAALHSFRRRCAGNLKAQTLKCSRFFRPWWTRQ